MGQSVYNLYRPLCDFLWDLLAVGTIQDRNPNKQALMLQLTPCLSFLTYKVGSVTDCGGSELQEENSLAGWLSKRFYYGRR